MGFLQWECTLAVFKYDTHTHKIIAKLPNFHEQLAPTVPTVWTAMLRAGTVHKAMFVTRSVARALVDANLGLILRIVFARNVSIIYR